jgi:DNA-binding transcriptional regulator YbjK
LLALARTPQALVDYANLVLAAGGLPKAVTDRFVTAISAMPTSTATTYGGNELERVRSALYLTISVPQGAIQK